MLKDLMKAILNEDVELDEEEVEEVQEPVKESEVKEEIFTQPQVQPVNVYKEPEIETFKSIQPEPKKEVKSSIFSGLDVDNVSKRETRASSKPYKYDRRKMMKLRTSEDMDYNPIISPIFGNVKEEKKAFDKVHDAIKLPKPEEDTAFIKIISPMYGSNIPEPKPVESIPKIKPEFKKKEEKSEPEVTLSLSDMLEKPKKQKTAQEDLFSLKD